MKRYHPLLLALTAMTSTSVIAGTMGPVEPDWTWVGSISGGPVWARGGDTQTFYLTPEIEKSYVAKKSTKTLGTGEIFLGIQKTLCPDWIGQIGLAGAYSGNFKAEGIIWDDADPQFDNYSYRYKINHGRVAVKGKLIYDQDFWVMPWISASVGVGFNDAHDFSNKPLIFEAIQNPNFRNHTETSFAYTVGAGIQKSLTTNWQVGVGYEFADWGQSKLGRAPEQTLHSGLKLDHLYTNGLLFNITYVA